MILYRKFISSFIILFVVMVSSCGADQKIVDRMADEMCSAFEKYDPSKPLLIKETVTRLEEIKRKSDYQTVTVSQLETSMFKKCRTGFNKFKILTEQSNYNK